MPLKKFLGSCHCGTVRFTAHADLSLGTVRCNCSYCRKIRSWAVVVQPESFELSSGAEALTEYRFGARREQHLFCMHCGVRPFGLIQSPRSGNFYAVNVGCLDNATVEELAQAPVRYVDGLNDNWDLPPLEVRHL